MAKRLGKITCRSDRVNDPNISFMRLYIKVFPAGKIVLGGNLASPARGALNNYFVIAKAQEPQLNQTASLDNSNMAKESFGNDKEHPQEKTVTLKIYPNIITGNKMSIEGTNFPVNELVTFTVIDATGKRMESLNDKD